MNNRQIGIIILAASLAMLYPLYSYTTNIMKLSLELHKNCTLPEDFCPYTRSVPAESAVGFIIDGGLIAFGFYLVAFSKEAGKVSAAQKHAARDVVKSLPNDEQKVYKSVVDSDGFLFQNELVEKTGLGKVKVTRILDKLEGKNLVERRRRGMSNVVVLKHQ